MRPLLLGALGAAVFFGAFAVGASFDLEPYVSLDFGTTGAELKRAATEAGVTR